MIDFKFNCPHCEQSLEAESDMCGEVISCPTCNNKMRVPIIDARMYPNTGRKKRLIIHSHVHADSMAPGRLSHSSPTRRHAVAKSLFVVLLTSTAMFCLPPLLRTVAPNSPITQRIQDLIARVAGGRTKANEVHLVQSGIQYGKESFSIVKAANGTSFLLDGYVKYDGGKCKASSPYAVFVVEVAEGATLGSQQFDQGSIVLVDGDETNLTYRLATPQDRLILPVAVSILGRKYSPGQFLVPPGGSLLAGTQRPPPRTTPGTVEGTFGDGLPRHVMEHAGEDEASSPRIPPLKASPGDVWVFRETGIRMRYIPSGTYRMRPNLLNEATYTDYMNDGSLVARAESWNWSMPPVFYVDAFWIAEDEVSSEHFRKWPEGQLTKTATNSTALQVTQRQAESYSQWMGGTLPNLYEFMAASSAADGDCPWLDTFKPDYIEMGNDVSPLGMRHLVSGPEWLGQRSDIKGVLCQTIGGYLEDSARKGSAIKWDRLYHVKYPEDAKLRFRVVIYPIPTTPDNELTKTPPASADLVPVTIENNSANEAVVTFKGVRVQLLPNEKKEVKFCPGSYMVATKVGDTTVWQRMTKSRAASEQATWEVRSLLNGKTDNQGRIATNLRKTESNSVQQFPQNRMSPTPTTPTQSEDSDILPPYHEQLSGQNEVRIRNPNEFSVKVGVRSGNKGNNLEVPENGLKSIYIPNGHFEIYFVYSNKPRALFQGDSFTLNGNGVEIRIVKVVNGNYDIRQVK